jgi:hypothetical protein
MHVSKRLLLACLTMESLLVVPALAADKVSLFKVITAKDEIVIGLSDDELAKMDGNAAGVAKALVPGARSAFGNMRCARPPMAISNRRRCAE